MIPNYLIIRAIIQLDPSAGWDVMGENEINILNSSITMEQVIEKAQELQAIEQQNLYKIERAKSYPSINDQLDMLWHMMDNETIPGKDSQWYNVIKVVKDSNPKPS